MTGNVQAKGEGDGEPLIVNHIYDSAIVPPPILAADFNFLYLYEFLVNRVFFGGLPHEDPNLHIKNFLLVCALHRQKNVSDDAFRLRLFPFSLKGKARTWLDDLPARSIHNWDELLEAFLDEFFPRGVIVELRCCVSIFKQKPHERPYVPARQPISTYHNQGQQFSLSEDNYEQAKEATDFSQSGSSKDEPVGKNFQEKKDASKS